MNSDPRLHIIAVNKSGEVVLGKDMVDFAWILPEEGKNYQIIPGILDEIVEVHKILNKN